MKQAYSTQSFCRTIIVLALFFAAFLFVAARVSAEETNSGPVEMDGRYYLQDEDGIVVTAAGTPIVNGCKYWVSDDGSLKTGWLNLGSWALYFDPDTFEAKIGLAEVEGKHYMFDQNGVMQTFAGTTIVNGKKYWFQNDGSLGSGWLYLLNWAMYYDPETYEARIGLAEVEGKHYMFDQNGVMQTYAGTTEIDGEKYWFTDDGSLASGWLNLMNWKLYFDPVTFKGVKGFQEIDGKMYWFDQNGVLSTKEFWSGTERTQADICDQVLLVRASGTAAKVSMLDRNAEGDWICTLETNGFVGRGGVGETTEWNGRTPEGIYGFTVAFGIKPDPGCHAFPYTQVDSTYYWVDDVYSPYYNQFVTTKSVPVNWNSAEHLIDYTASYAYSIAIDYNPSCTPGVGSAIFLHCSVGRATGGCVAVPEAVMIKILQNMKKDCKIIIMSE